MKRIKRLTICLAMICALATVGFADVPGCDAYYDDGYGPAPLWYASDTHCYYMGSGPETLIIVPRRDPTQNPLNPLLIYRY